MQPHFCNKWRLCLLWLTSHPHTRTHAHPHTPPFCWSLSPEAASWHVTYCPDKAQSRWDACGMIAESCRAERKLELERVFRKKWASPSHSSGKWTTAQRMWRDLAEVVHLAFGPSESLGHLTSLTPCPCQSPEKPPPTSSFAGPMTLQPADLIGLSVKKGKAIKWKMLPSRADAGL